MNVFYGQRSDSSSNRYISKRLLLNFLIFFGEISRQHTWRSSPRQLQLSIFAVFQDCCLRELPRQDICELARLWRCPLGKKDEKRRESPGRLGGKKKETFWGKRFTENHAFFIYLLVCRVTQLICVKIFETFLCTFHTKPRVIRVTGSKNFLNNSSLSDASIMYVL